MKSNIQKTIVLVFAFFFCLHPSAKSQIWWGLDSVYISPTQPNPGQQVKAIADAVFPSSGCARDSVSVTWLNSTTVEVHSYHCLGMLATICNTTDSVSLGNINAGNYTLLYYLHQGGSIPCGPGQLIDSSTVMFTIGCPPPAAVFTWSHWGDTLSFFGGMPGITNHWNFGDGDTSNLANPMHIFPDTGFYNVCKYVTDTCGSDTFCQNVRVCPMIIPSFSQLFLLSAGVYGYFVNTTSGATSYFWDFGDGGTSTDTDPTHLFPAPGMYWICLTASNACTSATLCDSMYISETAIENNIQAQLKFYSSNEPGNFQIENPYSEIFLLHLMNTSGQKIAEFQLKPGKNDIEIQGLATQLIFMQSRGLQSGKSWVWKYFR